MNEIKCPNCGTVFQINEEDYDSIVKQIRDKEFEREILVRENQAKKDLENAVKLTEAKYEKEITEKINTKELEINNLKAELKSKETETKSELEKHFNEELTKKTLEIAELKNLIKLKETENTLAIKDAVTEKDKEINDLNNKLELNKNEYLLKEKTIKESYEDKIKNKDEQIAYYKDFKARQSTKMIGESLENHCHTEFNKLRPLFPNAYFEKDNDAKTGSKGDFIFRDFDDEGTEVVSIMFEMKNEADETATKHKNEDFLSKLDKDRKEKGCEYAVLVSLLEMDNDLYNEGIVDMSHKYEKMYVVRPQNFIPIITILRNANLNSLNYKKELIVAQNQDIDFKNFENNMNVFKEAFGKNYELASRKFLDAIDDIDRTIKALEKTKADLQSSERNLRLANDKAQDLSIKKLTKNAPSIAKKLNKE